jgi:hypothetical protein
MPDSARHQDLNLQFKLKDLFLDFLACLVPGFVFVISITLLIGGLFYIATNTIVFLSSDILDRFAVITNELFHSYTFHFWVTLAIVFISFIVGHLLYRLNPKKPDYASFIRIRERVISDKNDWVIPIGHGVISKEVQFPYQNLKCYLEHRGFKYLADKIKWDSLYCSETNSTLKTNSNTILSQRSKSFINKLKIRIFFNHPNRTMNIIRNEAHIRLASSVWYATKYIIKSSYYSCFTIILLTTIYYLLFVKNILIFSNIITIERTINPNLSWANDLIVPLLFLSIFFVICGLISKKLANIKMRSWKEQYYEKEQYDDKNAKQSVKKNDNAKQTDNEIKLEKLNQEINSKENNANDYRSYILRCYNIYDLSPLMSFMLLFINSLLIFFSFNDISSTYLIRQIILYNTIVSFILIGTSFVKIKIEETIHYQRVREIIYVLETSFLSKQFEDSSQPMLID